MQCLIVVITDDLVRQNTQSSQETKLIETLYSLLNSFHPLAISHLSFRSFIAFDDKVL